jgi:hypothetical protein
VREGGEEEACLAEDFGATGMSRDVLQERVLFSVQRSSGTEPLVCVCMRVCVCVRACVRVWESVSQEERECVYVCVRVCMVSSSLALPLCVPLPLCPSHKYIYIVV